MAKVHFVEKAAKDNPVAKKGESYYYWTPFRSHKHYSKDKPKPSQLCSGRKSEVMAVQESLAEALDSAETTDDVRSACEEAAGEFRQLGDDYRDSVDNMPENFQSGEQCENMRSMGDSLDTAADTLEGLDFDGPDSFDDPEPEEPSEDDFEDDEAFDEAFNEWLTAQEEWESEKNDRDFEIEEFLEGLKDEARSASDDIEFMF